jgi:hypothetical protein
MSQVFALRRGYSYRAEANISEKVYASQDDTEDNPAFTKWYKREM